jgi:outer membrane protein OmpA-like peptidoglycan-associated protein
VFGPNESLPPVIEPPRGKARGPTGLVILILVGCVILEVPAYLLWKRSRRAENDLAALNEQAQVMRREVTQARAQSGTALTEASQAQANAAQAAQQRDQAVQARTQSEQQAAQAQLDAAVAAQRANRAQQQATQAQQEAATLRGERQSQLDHLQTVLAQIASTRKTASGLVVTLDSNAIRFDFDKSSIKPGNRELLSRMAGVLMTLQGYQIYVYGYTDSVGTDQYNQKLSERRAEAVRDYLVNSGVDPKIMTSKGYGKSDPLESGESAQARAKNRRVEIGIVDSVLRMESEVPPPAPDPH